MDLTPFTTAQAPQPAIRHDGWTPERKARFLDRLAACGNVRTACARVGMSREAAYRLRRRDELFARGWDAALMLARPSGADVLADKATEGIEEEVWYRGEMVGTRRRFDARLLLAHIARLDRMVEELPEESAEDAERFDELLARIGGVQALPHLEDEGESLPLGRDTAILMAEDDARDTVRQLQAERRRAEGKKASHLSKEEREAAECEIAEAAASAREQAGAQWDAWFAGACDAVDGLLGRPDAPPARGLPGDPLPPPGDIAGVAAQEAEKPAFSPPCTVSNVSTSSLARALSGPAKGIDFTPPRSPLQAPRAGRRQART